MNTFSGPMFESSDGSIFGKSGAHYNIYRVHAEQGMPFLREFFPDGSANELNAVLFSTSGVHGTYTTLEEIEAEPFWEEADGGRHPKELTFLVVQPRIVCLRYGNCIPRTPDDFAFLRRLRETSWAALGKIGSATAEAP